MRVLLICIVFITAFESKANILIPEQFTQKLIAFMQGGEELQMEQDWISVKHWSYASTWEDESETNILHIAAGISNPQALPLIDALVQHLPADESGNHAFFRLLSITNSDKLTPLEIATAHQATDVLFVKFLRIAHSLSKDDVKRDWAKRLSMLAMTAAIESNQMDRLAVLTKYVLTGVIEEASNISNFAELAFVQEQQKIYQQHPNRDAAVDIARALLKSQDVCHWAQ